MRIICYIILSLGLSLTAFGQKYLIEEDVNKDTIVPKFGPHRKFDLQTYLGVGWVVGNSVNKPPSEISYFKSWQYRQGLWFRVKLTKRYSIGALTEYAYESYRLTTPIFSDTLSGASTKWTKQINNNIVIGLFNRFHLRHDRTLIDLGAYYAFDLSPRIQTKERLLNANYDYKKTTYHTPDIMNRHNYGLDFRLSFSSVALYARYRLTGLYTGKNYDLPKMIVGMVLDLKSN